MKTFDAIIIGSGQGGTPLSKKLAKAGWKTVLIEKEYIGGTCINTGCTPTKTMIASAKALYTIAKAKELGVNVSGYSADLPAIIERKASVVKKFRNGSHDGLEQTDNLTLIFGTASFIGHKQLQVMLNEGGTEIVTADKIFIDTGGRPSIPKIDGLESVAYFTSSTMLELTEVPEHLLIIGGSYVALEFGQMFSRFGSQVTVLEHGKRILSREDEDISEEIKNFLIAENIKILTEAQATKVYKREDSLQVSVKMDKGEQTIACTHLLIAAGRTPNTDTLNLEATGVETDKRGHIKVNEKLETAAAGIFAMGDITGGPEFTHISYNDYIILADNLLAQEAHTTTGRMVPYCMFTDPQLGRVGLTEAQAREKGLNIKVAKLPMSGVARAIETGDTRGILKAVVDADTEMIAGVAVVGAEGGEIMSVLQMAMVGKVSYKKMANMIFAHPLYAEALNNLFMTLD